MFDLIRKRFPDEAIGLYWIIGIWIFFMVIFFILSSTYETKFEWITKINSGEWGDSFGVINPLLSAITILLVYKTYTLQKIELSDTKDALKGQEKTLKEQKLQSMIISLLELSQNHLNSLKESLESKFSTSGGKDLINLYIGNSPDISQDLEDGYLQGAILYFRTLKYIENIIINESGDDTTLLKNNIDLLSSQITDNIQRLHSLLLGKKEEEDKKSIKFTYLFSNIEETINFPKIKPKWDIYIPNI